MQASALLAVVRLKECAKAVLLPQAAKQLLSVVEAQRAALLRRARFIVVAPGRVWRLLVAKVHSAGPSRRHRVHAVKQELLLLLQSECCWQHRDTLAQQSKAAWALLHEIASAGEWTGSMHYTRHRRQFRTC